MRGSDPPVAPAFDCLNKYGIIRRVPQSVAQPVDGAADAVVEVDEYTLRPERLPELVAAQDLIGAIEQKLQSAKRQILNLDLDAVLAEFTGTQISLEDAEANDRVRLPRGLMGSWLHKL